MLVVFVGVIEWLLGIFFIWIREGKFEGFVE